MIIERRIMKLSAKKRFFKFLKDEGIWHLYWYNVSLYNERIKNTVNDAEFRILRKIKNPYMFVISSFDWSELEAFVIEDKCDFWMKMNTTWVDIITKEGIKVLDRAEY